jgi:hypothetical protein
MMTGDFSRLTFNPVDNVRTVTHFQGRPLTDADLNENSEATLRRIETEAVDVIGAEGAPLNGGGFHIVKDATQLAPAEAADPRNQSDGTLTNVQNAPFLITAGRYYIDGLQVENHRICGPLVLVSSSPAPRFQSQPMPLPANALAGTGTKIAFLRAVIDHRSGVEMPRLLDPGLGDADTSGRAVVAWQVGLMDAPAGTLCDTSVPAWDAMTAPSSGRMIVSLNATAPNKDPCKLTPGGGYVRPENLFYRVQVQDGIVARTCADGPRFQRDGLMLKVARNNGMEVARIVNVNGSEIKVSPGSRDGLPTFRQGDWIEFLKEGSEARGDASAGWTQVVDVAGDVVTVASAAGAANMDRIRLWAFDILTVPAVATDSLALEDGLEIKFPAGGEFRRGDYWQIPARYAVDASYWDTFTGKSEPPMGPRIEYARLATLTFNANVVQAVTDCRPVFEPLTSLLSFHYAGGDGQTVSPVGVAGPAFANAPSKLRAGVRMGRKPMKGALVRFELLPTGSPASAGLLTRDGGGPGAAAGVSVIATTGVDGIATVSWGLNLSSITQGVRATLLDPNDPSNNTTLPLAIEYSATLNRAAQVAYSPGACAGLNGIGDVQSALDKLCNDLANVSVQKSEFIYVEEVIALHGHVPIRNNEPIKPESLIEGIAVTFNEKIGIKVRGGEPIFRLWVDLPYPSDRQGREYWSKFLGLNGDTEIPIIGTIPLTLTGKIAVEGDGRVLLWQPDKMSALFLRLANQHRFGLNDGTNPMFDDRPVKGYLTVRGDCIWSESEDPRKYLNGEVLALQDGGNSFAMPPKRFDPQLAADYRLWFYFDV